MFGQIANKGLRICQLRRKVFEFIDIQIQQGLLSEKRIVGRDID